MFPRLLFLIFPLLVDRPIIKLLKNVVSAKVNMYFLQNLFTFGGRARTFYIFRDN